MAVTAWADMDDKSKRNLAGFTALFLLMLATRFHHFGTISTPPDASLAVFFLAGLYLTGRWIFPALLLEAVAIDLLATTYGGVSDWCITPAYVFLIPTYGVMWFGGYVGRRYSRLSVMKVTEALGILLLSIGLAFLVSNISFFFFSGNFEDKGLVSYLGSISRYYLPYTLPALAYVISGVLIHNFFLKRQSIFTPAQ